jgi:dTDP-3,4-didehydro-2,6-dideoxy-alpha-D-glucose 3-reductase
MKIKIGLITVGNHCQKNIIPSLIAMDDVEIVSFYTRSLDTASVVTKKYNITYYEDLDKMLAEAEINFVYITSPNALHYPHIIKALNNKINVIVEKTAISNLHQAEKVVDLAAKHNLLVYEAFMYRHHQQFSRLKEIIDNETYGIVKKVFINFGFPHLAKTDIRYSKELDGGALLDAGAYTISAMNSLLGENEYKNSGIYFENHSVDVNGYAIFKNTKNVQCFLNWGFGLGYKNEIQIWTNEGVIMIDRAFSKPSNFAAKIYHIKNGIETIDSCYTGNHFERMFKFVFSLDKAKYKTVNNELITQINTIELILKKENSIA